MDNRCENVIYDTRELHTFDNQNSSCDSSCDSSCCDYHSDDSIPEWVDDVLENGELFFIKCSPLLNSSLSCDSNLQSKLPCNKHNKFSKFLRKRKLKKKVKKPKALDVIKNRNYQPNSSFGESESRVNHTHDAEGHFAVILCINVVNAENEDSSPNDNVMYCFPQNGDKNTIFSIRGALLTLYHLLPKLVSEVPESSTLLVNDELIHLVYLGTGKELLIIALPEKRCSLFELKQLSSCIVRYLNFRYKSLHECFKNPVYRGNLNQFFGNLLIKMFENTFNQSRNLQNSAFKMSENAIISHLFEESFRLPNKLNISYNLEMKIEERLNELEANDFGDLSEDHYRCQRLYTIAGTCLYHKGYLIVSHLSKEDQLDVHTFLLLNDLLDLTITSVIESLVIWQEVYMSTCSYCVEGSRTFPTNKRWFLLIIGQDQSLLATLLESGGCSVSSADILKPDELYVEQIQDVLDDIIHYGLADAVEIVLRNSEMLPSPKNTSFKLSESILHFGNVNLTKSSSTISGESDTNIRHSSPPFSNGNFDDTYSDSLSRTVSSALSDESAPVLGRRAQRMKQLSNSGSIYPLHSNLSDSDRSDVDTTGSSHSSSFADFGKKSPKECVQIRKIIHGDSQALFHYVNLLPSKGIVICPLSVSGVPLNLRHSDIMNSFRLYAQKIHYVLSQKKISSIGKNNRHALPVSEFGISFECDDESEKEKKNSTTFWVVGRVFNNSHLGEVYICYEDKIPQNMVEIAFRLAMLS